MKVIVDAHLPRRVARWFETAGCDSLHVSTLPDGNRTTDVEITRIADLESRVVVAKDSDFVDSHLLRGTPRQLLLLSVGNNQQQVS